MPGRNGYGADRDGPDTEGTEITPCDVLHDAPPCGLTSQEICCATGSSILLSFSRVFAEPHSTRAGSSSAWRHAAFFCRSRTVAIRQTADLLRDFRVIGSAYAPRQTGVNRGRGTVSELALRGKLAQ